MIQKFSEEQKSLIEYIGRTWLAIKQKTKVYLKDLRYDLSIEQIIVLAVLEEFEGMTIGNLAVKIDRERTTLSRMIDNLENRNLVIKITDKKDKRKKLIYLTPLGRNKIEEVVKFSDDYFYQMFQDIKAENLEICQQTIKSIGLMRLCPKI